MPFKKGTSGNPKGRPKGIYNQSVRKRVERLLHQALPAIEQELETGTSEAKREIFFGLAGIVMPNTGKPSAFECRINRMIESLTANPTINPDNPC